MRTSMVDKNRREFYNPWDVFYYTNLSKEHDFSKGLKFNVNMFIYTILIKSKNKILIICKLIG